MWESLGNLEGYPSVLVEFLGRWETHSVYTPIPLPSSQTPEERARLAEALLDRNEAFNEWLERDY